MDATICVKLFNIFHDIFDKEVKLIFNIINYKLFFKKDALDDL